jgi:uncharacterized heparinase superfamily protein
MSVSRPFHTLRPLRAGQLRAQLGQRLRRRWERPERWARRPAPPDPGRRWRPRAEFLAPGPQRNTAEDLRAGDFVFLNRRERPGWPPSWSNPQLPRLWEYNLHYFDYLWALPWDAGRELARDWIARHPLARGRVGWEPYPISLRLVNWCAWFYGRHGERCEADAELRSELWESLWRQAEWLAAHLEFHLLGNHLLENAAALAFVGACFEGAEAETWRRRGLALLGEELAEQVLPDGGHFERSPMYQARVAYVLRALAWTGDAELLRCVQEPLARVLGALDRLRHPDGEIALLNDAALAIANAPGQLCVGDPPTGPFALPETGYFGARSPEQHYIVCDAAPIGPDYLPGHAHGDIFSFELSLAGRRVLVDAGVHDYEPGELRRWCRSTRAHNTVELDGEDQCEFWAAFRVARRGRPRDVVWEDCGEGFRLESWHDGYQRLPARARHARAFRWHPQGVLLVRDTVTARRPVTVRSRLHLHPDCELLGAQDGLARLRHPGGVFAVHFAGEGELSVEPSLFCPEFGKQLESRALVFAARGARVEMGFCVAAGGRDVAYDLAAGARVGDASYPW